MGGTMSATARRRSRRIWLISLRIRLTMRRREPCRWISLMALQAQLHSAHLAPDDQVEDHADGGNHRHRKPHSGPPSAFQQGIADDLDVVAAPYDAGDPAQSTGNVLHRKDQSGQQEYQQESAERDCLDGCRLIGNGGSNERSESGYAKGVQDGRYQEGSRVAGKAQAEVGEEGGHGEDPFE